MRYNVFVATFISAEWFIAIEIWLSSFYHSQKYKPPEMSTTYVNRNSKFGDVVLKVQKFSIPIPETSNEQKNNNNSIIQLRLTDGTRLREI